MGGVIRNERICTPPLEGLRRGDAHTNENTQHTPSRRSRTESPQAATPPATTKTSPSPSTPPPPTTTDGSTRGPQTAAPPPRRRAADRTESAHTRDRANPNPNPNPNPEQVVAQRRAVQPVVPRPRPPAGIAARHRWHVACSGRLVVQVQPLERRPDLALRPTPLPTRPSPSVPQIDQRPVRARRAVEGAHAAQYARRGREMRAANACLGVPVRVRHGLAPPQRSAQVRPHLPGEAGARGRSRARSTTLRAAPPREARERGRGAGGHGGAGRAGQGGGSWWRGRGGGGRSEGVVCGSGRGHAGRSRGAPRPLARNRYRHGFPRRLRRPAWSRR